MANAGYISALLNLTNTSQDICPHSIDDCQESHYVSYDIGTGPSYVAITSSAVSCIGSLLIILVYYLFKDLRSSAQKIITFLAVADLISALGYIGGSINFVVHFNDTNQHQCRIFNYLCIAQASLTSWSSLASFSWTLTLAFYFYVVIVYSRQALVSKLMILYHILAWVVPLFIIVPMAATKTLGYAAYAASNWCFVHSSPTHPLSRPKMVGYVLLAGKFWEILTYIISIYIYIHIFLMLVLGRKRYQPLQRVSVAERVERRLLFIPAFFLALRIWGTVQFFFSVAVYHHNHKGCIPKNYHTVFEVLGYLQAVGDPGQGWGNAVVYVFLSPTVRHKLFSLLCRRCIRSFGGWLISMANTTEEHHQQQQQHARRSSNSSGEHQKLARRSLAVELPFNLPLTRKPGSLGHWPQVLHTAPAAASFCTMTASSSCDITEAECGPTPGAETDPSPTPQKWRQ